MAINELILLLEQSLQKKKPDNLQSIPLGLQGPIWKDFILEDKECLNGKINQSRRCQKLENTLVDGYCMFNADQVSTFEYSDFDIRKVLSILPGFFMISDDIIS
jgi:hypothetical protein